MKILVNVLKDKSKNKMIQYIQYPLQFLLQFFTVTLLLYSSLNHVKMFEMTKDPSE